MIKVCYKKNTLASVPQEEDIKIAAHEHDRARENMNIEHLGTMTKLGNEKRPTRLASKIQTIFCRS